MTNWSLIMFFVVTGGDILFRNFDHDTGVVHVTMKGACVSCASSTITLRFMVLRLLQHYVDEVKDVEGHDDTDDNGSDLFVTK